MTVTSLESWISKYKGIQKQITTFGSSTDGILLGFNVNIDKIIYIDPTTISKILSFDLNIGKNDLSIPPSLITNRRELFIGLFHAIMEGKADETIVNNEKIGEYIESTFTIDHELIGGQAGIIANFLAEIGIRNIAINLPLKSKKLMKLLNPRVMLYNKKANGDVEHSIPYKDENLISHYIFEFKKGVYTFNDIEITCPRNNRFIASLDFINSQLTLDQDFVNFSIANTHLFNIAIVSGFHLINLSISHKKSYEEVTKPVISLIKEWKKRKPSLITHFEFASTKSKILLTLLNKLLPFIDSIGMNEQELLTTLYHINMNSYHSIKNKFFITDIFDALVFLLSRYPHLRIHFHTLGYYLVISKPINKFKANARLKGLLSAALMAYAKANDMNFMSIKDVTNINDLLSKTGYEKLTELNEFLNKKYMITGDLLKDGIVHSKGFTLIAIPTIIAKHPTKLVGLGDIISSSALLEENSNLHSSN